MSLNPGSATLTVDDDPRRYEHLSRIRLEDPEAVARAAKARRRHPGPKAGKQNFIVAADHPARGALAVGSDPVAMADRRQLLDRLRIALANPDVDGVLASPDIMDDLLLLGALEGKLVFGSMNRGGLTGLVNEFDDRFTGHTAAALEALGADGGKMLTRICLEDPDTVVTLEATAKAIDSLAERKLIAMVEPFLSVRVNGKVRNDLSTDAVIKSIAIAEGLGSTSAYTWMKLPVVAQMERVMRRPPCPPSSWAGTPRGHRTRSSRPGKRPSPSPACRASPSDGPCCTRRTATLPAQSPPRLRSSTTPQKYRSNLPWRREQQQEPAG